MNLFCKTCGKDFVPKNKQHSYCSGLCRERYRRRDRTKMNAYNRDYRAKNKEKGRGYHLKNKFGLTLDQYELILEQQGGGCAICGRTPEEEKRSLAVDHDHSSGEIFGILCWFCNHKFIGKNRNPELYLRAAQYLRQGQGLFVREPNVPEFNI